MAGARLRTGIFWALAAALLACHLVVAWHSLTVARLWEDEAYNLTVPLNLLAGLGYTSDGTLYGSTLAPFDPRISTGPAALLPAAAVLATGVDPVIGARLVPLLYWGLLLAGLGILGARLGGRFAALLAMAVPLAFDATQTVSPIQGPADLLGEIPAAALLVWALIALPRRAWLAGLLVGLAIQAKLIALLALPAFAVALWVLAPGRGAERLRATFRRSLLPLAMAAIPSLLFEVAALVQLGPAGYPKHLRSLGGFILSGGQGGPPTTLGEKLLTFADSWFLWPALAALSALLGAALVLGGMRVTRRTDAALNAPDRSVLAAAALGLITYLLWWGTASHLPLWIRHPSPGILAFLPILAAGAVWGARMLWRRDAPGQADAPEQADASEQPDGEAEAPRGEAAGAARAPGLARRLGAAAAIAIVTVSTAASVGLHVRHALTYDRQTLEGQRAAAAPLAAWVEENDVAWLAAHPWGAAVPIILLTGAHIGLSDAPSMADVPRLTGLECDTEVLAESRLYRICAP